MRGDSFGLTQKEVVPVRDGLSIRFWWKGQTEDETRTQVGDIDHMLLLPRWGKKQRC